MKHKLKEGNRVIVSCEESAVIPAIVEDVKKQSFYRSHQDPRLALGAFPHMTLWKVKVEFTTGTEKDMTYKTEPVG